MSSENYEHIVNGFELSIWTFLLTVLLEAWSFETVKKLLGQKGAGRSLYFAAIMTNLRNHFIFGTPLYFFAVVHFSTNAALKTSERVASVAAILFVHSLCFYAVHKAFHEHPSLYRFHKFHHRFNIHVPPMAANAVSPTEYIVAYLMPFVLAMAIIGPDIASVRISVMTVSVTNVMLHTPKLAALSVRLFPEWLVATEDHLEHHRKLNTKYAAPTFNVDYLVELLESVFSTKKKVHLID